MRTLTLVVGVTVTGDVEFTDEQIREAVIEALLPDPDGVTIGNVDGVPAVNIAAVALTAEVTYRGYDIGDPRR